MSQAAALLDAVVEEIKDEAVELIPIAFTALKGLLDGQPPEKVLSRAEREALATYAQKRLDAALERSKANKGT